MNDAKTKKSGERNWSETLYLPVTDFPMRAGLPEREPEMIARWDKMSLYRRLREVSKDRPKYMLHDGPPYANGHLHIGHALNKILKDIITRSFQMRGYDSNYVPGWDCHGLPIEWKIEEQYREKGLDKNDVPVNEFRRQCREFAEHWIKVQTSEFRRLGVEGDFETPYTTMNFHAEARIAGELMKFATTGQLYRGSKPVMWSVVERTALAEAEVEYQDYESDTVWVKFPVTNQVPVIEVGIESWRPGIKLSSPPPQPPSLLHENASVVIWTTTPWTIPGNRAISFSPRIDYGLYEVTKATNDFGPQAGEKLIFADKLAEESFKKAKLEFRRLRDVAADELSHITCAHPLKGLGGGYEFQVPLLAGEHVTDDAGTGFVHTAPGHGREDFDVWMDAAPELRARGIDTAIPFTVDDAGFFTKDAPGFGPDRPGGPARVIDDNGKKGDANKAVIDALIAANMLFARGRLKHTYPHSWRSKKPVIFRNTPQWFVHMDGDIDGAGDTLRARSLKAISQTRFVPAAGQNRLATMIEQRPDWVLSRQRAWGVPIAVFVDDHGEILKDKAVNARILEAFENEGADAWFADGARERFLGSRANEPWTMVKDILDVWFDSGSTHTFCLEDRPDLKWPADVYLEGSDQHRGWFHSSLLESCGTRGRAPYDTVITHGFLLDEKGTEKMSKSKGNALAPKDVFQKYGADILRLWVASSDYWNDIRFGPEILNANVDSYRKLRNTLRWMLGTLAHDRGEEIPLAQMPELERLMLHRLAELDAIVREAYDAFDFKRVTTHLSNFMTVELSAFYFDIRKDALYCDPPSSLRRKAALQTVRHLFDCLVKWLAPLLPFTMDEAWVSLHPGEGNSVHLELFPVIPANWRDDKLAAKWRKIKTVRRVVTGALEIERMEKRIGLSLEASPVVHVADRDLLAALAGIDFAEICITSEIDVREGEGPQNAFRLADGAGVAVEPKPARGKRCARSWRILPEVGSDPEYPELSLRDAQAMREILSGLR